MEHSYLVVEVIKLSGFKHFAAEIIEYKRKPFSSMSITSRCLTINETNYNFANKTSWKVEIKTANLGKRSMVEVDEGAFSNASSEDE